LSPALGCSPYTALDGTAAAQSTLLSDQQYLAALALNELQARSWQLYPIAAVEASDEMVEDANGNLDLQKLNAYRAGVDQLPVTAFNQASPLQYCVGLLALQPYRLELNKAALNHFPTPDVTVGNNLYTFMVGRLLASLTSSANCPSYLNIDANTQLPYTAVVDPNTGGVTQARLNVQAMNGLLSFLSLSAQTLHDARVLQSLTCYQLEHVRIALSPLNGLAPTTAQQLVHPYQWGGTVITVPLADGSGFVNVHIPPHFY